VTEFNLKNATERDDQSILNLLTDMHAEAGMGSLNKAKVLNAIRHCRQLGCIILVEVNGLPAAVMGLKPDRFWWSDDLGLFDQFTYVAPSARKTKAIFKMVDAATKMAKDAGIPLLLANFGTVDTQRKSRLYKRFGKDLGTTVITGDTSTFLWK
jgi:GNAT superfamily N-acetyltransferase